MHRHTDEETGVGRWWKPFDVNYEFKFTGLNNSAVGWASAHQLITTNGGLKPTLQCNENIFMVG